MLATGLPTIILAHLPDTIAFEYAYRDWDIDLFLSGHTHGGVIRIPGLGGIYAPMQDWFPKYDMGYFDLGKTELIISSGLSGHGSIPRIFNRPEICVVHIKP
jgi:predicted MPP superfamily phosphohydrolase